MTDATPLASEQITQADKVAAEVLVAAHCAEWRWPDLHVDQVSEYWLAVEAAATGIAYARATALSASPAPVGWKLVPVEPTSEMTEAGEDANYYSGDDIIRNRADPVYRAMLAASPAPSGQGVSGEVCAHCKGAIGDLAPGRDPEELCDTCYKHSQQNAAPAPSCAPGEVGALAWISGYAADCARNPDQPTNTIRNAFAAIERKAIAALSPQGLDAKERWKREDAGLAPWGYGWYDDGGGKHALPHLPTCITLRGVSSDAFPLYRHPATPSQRLDAATVERCAQVAAIPSCERCRKPSPQGLRCYDCLSGEVEQLRFEADRAQAQSDPASAVSLLLKLAEDEDAAKAFHDDPKDRGRCAIIAAEFRRVARVLSDNHGAALAAISTAAHATELHHGGKA